MISRTVFSLSFLACVSHAQQVDISTKYGPVRGERVFPNGNPVDAFLSIPFAAPPIGTFRFEPPQPITPWTDPLDVTKPSPACIQMNISTGAFASTPGSTRHYEGTFSEDCLYLSVWRPSYANENTNLAVMVWIYGGGFNYGMKDYPLYNGQYLSGENGVIVVSMNYRVGLLGFGYLGQETIPANAGLYDQLAALIWVRENIKLFGGDPNKVTLFGESAGSWSVGLHLVSPLSERYFNNAILQSGAPVNAFQEIVLDSAERSRKSVERYAEYLNCNVSSEISIYDCLMKVPAEEIVMASNILMLSGVDFYPIIDNYFLREHPLALMKKGAYKSTNVMIGFTKDEFSIFFPAFVNTTTLMVYETGEKLSNDYVDRVLSISTRYADRNRIKMLRLFYESMMSNPQENLPHVLNSIGTDLMFACPSVMFASNHLPINDVYFYVLNYRISTTPPPLWTGVPHTYDIDLVFGHPFGSYSEYTNDDREVSKMMMTYWTNFAKSGNPNFPVEPELNWLTFNPVEQTYLALDTQRTLEHRRGPRRHECTFIDKILPLVEYDDRGENKTDPDMCHWWPNSSGNLQQKVGVVAALVLFILAFF